MEKLKSFFEDGVEFVEIRNVDFYCKTDFWPFMPERMFHELELSETNGVFRGELIVSKVLKEDFDRMIAYHDAFANQMQCN